MSSNMGLFKSNHPLWGDLHSTQGHSDPHLYRGTARDTYIEDEVSDLGLHGNQCDISMMHYPCEGVIGHIDDLCEQWQVYQQVIAPTDLPIVIVEQSGEAIPGFVRQMIIDRLEGLNDGYSYEYLNEEDDTANKQIRNSLIADWGEYISDDMPIIVIRAQLMA